MSGVVSAGLRTTVLPHASAGAIFHAAMSSGKFHGMICPATPSGRATPTVEGVVELVGPPRVIEEVRRRERDVDVARLLDRLAAVHRLDDRELARLLLDRARDAEDVLRALASAHLRPVLVVRVARGFHRVVDVVGVRLGDLGELLLGARADRVRSTSRSSALRHLPPMKSSYRGVDLDVIGRLGRRRVLPRLAEVERVLALLLDLGSCALFVVKDCDMAADPIARSPRTRGRDRSRRARSRGRKPTRRHSRAARRRPRPGALRRRRLGLSRAGRIRARRIRRPLHRLHLRTGARLARRRNVLRRLVVLLARCGRRHGRRRRRIERHPAIGRRRHLHRSRRPIRSWGRLTLGRACRCRKVFEEIVGPRLTRVGAPQRGHRRALRAHRTSTEAPAARASARRCAPRPVPPRAFLARACTRRPSEVDPSWVRPGHGRSVRIAAAQAVTVVSSGASSDRDRHGITPEHPRKAAG